MTIAKVVLAENYGKSFVSETIGWKMALNTLLLFAEKTSSHANTKLTNQATTAGFLAVSRQKEKKSRKLASPVSVMEHPRMWPSSSMWRKCNFIVRIAILLLFFT
ncbi:hypothetical protein Y032_0735g1937 [Ancylostoma ceylanicum]|uniref:Uncharacterized protein n=1 Tax=Ancylostoma ceylanicum TaxID=53326 RepID=A0A016WEY3_9BILA|nr:hypothetical protein Y032_0735g1937 [Ancylostoma ceylanicum]